jgi:hypothetical protein
LFPPIQQLSNRSFISFSTLTFSTWKETNTEWIVCSRLAGFLSPLSVCVCLLKLTNNTKTYNKTTSTTTWGKKKQVGAVWNCAQHQRRNLY